MIPTGAPPAVAAPAPGGPLAYLGTFLLATLFYAVTLHVAARYVLGAVPFRRALAVAPAPALSSILLAGFGPAVVAPATFAVASVAIVVVYDLRYRTALLVAVFYYAVAVLVGLTVRSLLGLLE